ncbi:MAG: RidA family protein [Stackebrandtia sp.]
MTDNEFSDAGTLRAQGHSHHVTIAEPGRLAILQGQCPVDASEKVVGVGDVETQVRQIAANTLSTLHDVGAGPEHVIRSVVYVLSDDSAEVSRVWRLLVASPIGEAFRSASSVVGVSALGYPDQLVEVELTARLPE